MKNRQTINWKRLLGYALVSVVIGVLVTVAVLLGQYQDFRKAPLNIAEPGLVYEIAQGTSLKQLAYDLQRRGITGHPHYLIWLGRELDLAHRLQAGEYEIIPGMTPESLLRKLAGGEVIQHAITLIEGQTFKEMLAVITSSGDIVHTLDGVGTEELMVQLGHEGEHPEGRFLPDTYHFPQGTTDLAFLTRAYNAMKRHLAEAWAAREEGLPLDTPYEALILASIVEKETGVAGERPVIAGVFIRRLKKGMRLQTDPTVIYGLGERFDGNLRSSDLRSDTPYNTYTRDGLPPTPIAMPGAASIHAVLHPDKGDALFFVANGTGGHYFSRTLMEHELAVKKFQLGKSVSLPPPTR
ncbi:MAG: endolytic transglycosylase MltG [Gammaproteobacteria bacterium]